MIFLNEREVGYDKMLTNPPKNTSGIGYPSISGCIAIAYQVDEGMFGFHNVGNSADDKFDERARKFANWVQGHPKGRNAGLALYGVTFARSNDRGYSQPPVSHWKAELKTFAARLGFAGPIYGYDLTQHFKGITPKPSAYVQISQEGNGYSIFVRQWYRSAKDGYATGTYAATTDFKHLDSTTATSMCTGVDTSGISRAYPERLGGN